MNQPAKKQSHLSVVSNGFKNGAKRTSSFMTRSAKFVGSKTKELVKSPEFKMVMFTMGAFIVVETVVLGTAIAFARVNAPGTPFHGMRGWEALRANGMKPFDPPIVIELF